MATSTVVFKTTVAQHGSFENYPGTRHASLSQRLDPRPEPDPITDPAGCDDACATYQNRYDVLVRTLAIALLATGCTEFRWPGDDLALRPETTERLAPIAERWRAEVATAAERWNLAAELAGCSVRFRLDDGPDAHPVRLYLRSEWPFDDDHIGETLGGPDGAIDVVDRWGTRTGDNLPTLLHELGHALGLEHGLGVMAADVPALTEPTADDIAALAAGC